MFCSSTVPEPRPVHLSPWNVYNLRMKDGITHLDCHLHLSRNISWPNLVQINHFFIRLMSVYVPKINKAKPAKSSSELERNNLQIGKAIWHWCKVLLKLCPSSEKQKDHTCWRKIWPLEDHMKPPLPPPIKTEYYFHPKECKVEI